MKNMPYIYLYDGSLINLLNLIKYLYKNKMIPHNIKIFDYQPNLLEEVVLIDFPNDENIINDILKSLGSNILNTIYYLYISNEENKELLIFYFFGYSLKYKNKVFYMRNINCISKSLKVAHYVTRENHKFKGFLRFKELQNKILYAEMEPENDIILLLSKHFAKRLKNEYWIIKDVRRDTYSIYDKIEFRLVNGEEFTLNNNGFSNSEEMIQSLWKTFYKTIGISERKNERCRMNFMPKKYWKYILEVSDELEKDS